MTLDEALKAQLIAYAPLNDRIHGRVLAQALTENTVLEALTFQRISGPPAGQHRGGSRSSRVRYQVDAWSTTSGGAQTLRLLVRLALHGWSRPADPRIDRTLLLDDRDLPDQAIGRKRASLDFDLWAQEI